MEIPAGSDALFAGLALQTQLVSRQTTHFDFSGTFALKTRPSDTRLLRGSKRHRRQKMENGKMRFTAPVSRDRVISKFPMWYTPQACLQTKDHWHSRVKAACKDRVFWLLGVKMSKVVVVGDLYVGKTCLINRFCKDLFDRDYKATIGVDFEIERFEVLGFPYSLQIWDTAGQEKFKCIASTYYRGAQVIIVVFDLADIRTLEHTRQWLDEALKENEPRSCSVFLIGAKKDLLAPAECERVERDAIKMAAEMGAEFWALSSKTGENVRECFFRVAALAFEDSVMQAQQEGAICPLGTSDIIKIDRGKGKDPWPADVKRLTCC